MYVGQVLEVSLYKVIGSIMGNICCQT